jgi:hypothetical protein
VLPLLASRVFTFGFVCSTTVTLSTRAPRAYSQSGASGLLGEASLVRGSNRFQPYGPPPLFYRVFIRGGSLHFTSSPCSFLAVASGWLRLRSSMVSQSWFLIAQSERPGNLISGRQVLRG